MITFDNFGWNNRCKCENVYSKNEILKRKIFNVFIQNFDNIVRDSML